MCIMEVVWRADREVVHPLARWAPAKLFKMAVEPLELGEKTGLREVLVQDAHRIVGIDGGHEPVSGISNRLEVPPGHVTRNSREGEIQYNELFDDLSKHRWLTLFLDLEKRLELPIGMGKNGALTLVWAMNVDKLGLPFQVAYLIEDRENNLSIARVVIDIGYVRNEGWNGTKTVFPTTIRVASIQTKARGHRILAGVEVLETIFKLHFKAARKISKHRHSEVSETPLLERQGWNDSRDRLEHLAAGVDQTDIHCDR